MTAILVAAISVIFYFLLSQGLERIAESSLREKMEGIEHSISQVNNLSEISSETHALVDLTLGHSNFHASFYTVPFGRSPLFTIGSKDVALQVHSFSVSNDLRYHEWKDESDRPMLSGSKILKIKDGTPISVYLSIDRTSDSELLASLARTALFAYPFVLLVILLLAWWTVRQGLKPLNSFLRIASEVSTDNLGHRLPTEGLPMELETLAKGINFMLHRLDDGVQQLSQFSDDLAHELRAPITNLMGKAQVALTRDRSSAEYRAVLECCTEELDRLTRIVADMLFLAHVSHPAALVQFEAIALQDETEQVVDLFSLSAEESNVRLLISGTGSVSGNRLMIQRAISNLLSNAIRHCPPGEAVQMQISRNANMVRLSVRNPGQGIPAEHLPHLFERFYRVDKGRARSEGGTGLGLSIVRSIMSLHQGTASVEVTGEQVTIFHLDFPALKA